METDATYRGTACEFVGVHMDRQARKSTPFAPAIRSAAEKHLEPAMA